jgi:hypothetical protein
MRLGLFFVWMMMGVAGGKPPVLKHVYPAGGQVGTTVQASVGGTFDPWPLEFWTSHADIEIVALEKKGQVELRMGMSVPEGMYLVAARNTNGYSDVRWIQVGTLPEIVEDKPNETQVTAQEITQLPVVLNGRLETGGDVDHFRISLKKGESLSVRMTAYGLDAPVDAMLHLFDAQRVRKAFNHDAFNLDPWLVYTATDDGEYVLSVSGFKNPPAADVNLMGSKETVYRLHLKKKLEAAVRDFPELVEGKGAIRGAVAEKEMTYPLEAKKGQQFQFTVHAASLGYDIDPVLRILDTDDKQVVRFDDRKDKQLDPEGDWKVPKEGRYKMAVSDLHGRTGEDMKFQIDFAEVFPSFAASTETFAVGIETGGTAKVSLAFERVVGETNRVSFVAEGLPPGVWASIPDGPKKSGEVTMTLGAGENVALGHSSFNLFALTPDETPPRKVLVPVKLKGVATPHEDLGAATREAIFLTVRKSTD